MNLFIYRIASAAVLAAGLTGCASFNSVNADVSSYSQWPAERKPSSYAYERLPSQQAQAQQQDELEAAARKALGDAGFSAVTDAAAADVTVQLSTRLTRFDQRPYDDPFWRFGLGFGFPMGRYSSFGFGTAFPISGVSTYEREVAVLIRDRKSGRALYETRASSNDRSNSAATLAAMFEAALKDFPQPAVNPRRVTVALPTAPQ